MKLFLSHRIERLVDHLAEQIAENLAPLDEQWILVPSLINKQWLMVELLRRLETHSIANLKILGWRDAFFKLSRASHPVPDDIDLQLALLKIFSNKDLPVEFESLVKWLQGGPTRAQVFIAALSRQIQEAGYYGSSQNVPWQQRIVDMLFEDGWRFPFDVLANASIALPMTHCFGVDEMPSYGWKMFSHAPSRVFGYLFSPCCMFWEDILSDGQRRQLTKRLGDKGMSSASLQALEGYLQDTHPLLANWGKLGRAAIHHLESIPLDVVESYEGCEDDLAAKREKYSSNQISLLQMIQHDLLFLRTRDDQPLIKESIDASIQIIAAGSSRLREMQILHDQLIQFKLDNPGTPYSEMLVLAPDIGQYEPLIHFVFKEDFPIRIVFAAVLPNNSYLQALLLILSLNDRLWDADVVLELFENPSFQAKHRITQEDLEWFRRWMQEAEVRGSLKDRKGNWIDGLKRMVAGLVYLLPDDEPMARIRSIDWGQADRLDLFIHLIAQLQEYEKTFHSQEKHTLEEWASLLKKMASDLLEESDSNDAIFCAFIRKILSASYQGDPVPFGLLRSILENDCASAATTFQGPFVEAVQFSSIKMGSVRPAQAIFLLGMDSESFPRKVTPSSIDWQYVKPDEADCDRSLLLQCLFSASKQLSISYSHISSQDGKIIEPALPIQELLQVIDEFYPLKNGKMSSALTQIHPTLPFDARYFIKNSPVHSFSETAYLAATVSNKPAPAIFWSPREVKETNAARVFDLKDFYLLARHPWKYFLQKKLGIYLKDEKLFSDLRLDDFVMRSFHEQNLLKLAMKQPIDQVLAQHAYEFPPGLFGEWSKTQLKNKSSDLDSFLQKWDIKKEEIFSIRLTKEATAPHPISEHWIEAPLINVTSSSKVSVTISGEIELASRQGLFTMGELDLFGIIRRWPAFLAYLTTDFAQPALFSLKKGKSKSWSGLDVPKALRRWVDYALLAEESLSPLIQPWADAFLQKGFEKWKEEAEHTLMKNDDPTIRYVLERSQPVPYQRIWDEWNEVAAEIFSDLLKESEHAAV